MAKDNPNRNYKYIGSSTKPEDQVFNQDYFDKLVSNRQYQDAYDYAIQYPMIDAIEEAENMNDLKNMLRQGHLDEAIYHNVDESAYPILDFRNNVMQPGGLETLSSDNEYANKFKEYKRNIGGGENKLKIVFEPQKQKALGLDFLKKDNDYASIEKFYEDTGLNKQYLEANGVKVGLRDGKSYFEFDKSNDLANQILLNVKDTGVYGVKVYGVKEDGSLVNANGDDNPDNIFVSAAGYTPTSNISAMQRLYKDAQKIEEKSYEMGTARIKQHSSQIFPLLYENAVNLEEQLAENQIKDASFNSRIKRENEKLINKIAGIDPSKYEIQTSFYNEDGSPVNVPIEDQFNKEALIERYRNTEKNKIKYGVAIVGNRVGLYVQLPEVRDSKGNIETYNYNINGKDVKMKMNSAMFTIFGDDIEQQLQRQVNSDPKMQAYQEIADMQDYGYTYKDNNGNSYTYDGLGGWIVNGTDKSKSEDWVRRQIHKDKAAQDIGRGIVMENISVDGSLVNPKRYSNQIMAASFAIAEDVDKNGDIIRALKDIYGDSIDYTDANSITAAIFSLKGMGNVVADEYRSKIANPATYQKLNDIYEICANMLNVGRRYIHNINEE